MISRLRICLANWPLLSSFRLKREADYVTLAEAGAYLTITHSMDSRLRGNDVASFRKHDYLLFASFGADEDVCRPQKG